MNLTTSLGILALGLAVLPRASAGEFEPNRIFVISAEENALRAFDIGAEPEGDNAFVSDTGTDFAIPAGTGGGLAFGPDGLLYVAAFLDPVVQAYDGEGTLVRTYDLESAPLAPKNLVPQGLIFGPDGHLFVSSSGDNNIYEFAPDGSYVRVLGSGLNFPTGMAFDARGHLFVSSLGSHKLFELAPDGKKLQSDIGLGSGLDSPRGLTFGPDGRLYVASQGTDTVAVFDQDMQLVDEFDDADLSRPIDVDFGPDGLLYVTNEGVGTSGSDKIVRIDPVTGERVAELPTFGDAQIDRGLAMTFAPYRYTAKITGKFARNGASISNLKETVTLSISPGDRTLSLAVVDETDEDDDLASIFGQSWFHFVGYLSVEDSRAKKRSLHGSQVSRDSLRDGVASVVVELKGNAGKSPVFELKKATGTLHRASPQGVLTAKIKSGKRLD